LEWLFLIYHVPAQPSKKRVYIWRKLKRIGALYLVDSVSVLPYSERNREHFQWINAEIIELGGAASFWRSVALGIAQEEDLIRRFNAQAAEQYQPLAEALDQWEQAASGESSRDDVLTGQDWANHFRRVHTIDFFHSEPGEKLRARLEHMINWQLTEEDT
jgi:hypothetical protein